MNVEKILKRMALIGVGLDNPTSADQAVFLEYLNLAHFELYRLVAVAQKAFLMTRTNHQTDDQGVFDIIQFPFTIESVIDVDRRLPLDFVSLDDIKKTDALVLDTGTPTQWFLENKKIVLYPNPEVERDIQIWSVPQPVEFELNTTEEDIPYPAAYHDVLMHGASYYVFQGEDGFKNPTKMSLAELKWGEGKTSFLDYLQRFQSPLPTTYTGL